MEMDDNDWDHEIFPEEFPGLEFDDDAELNKVTVFELISEMVEIVS
ncbi:MAG TPA: hypothetical protein VHB20_15320 [Verrucomicrobiae bacterium]|jgi:hypothetical protein|nr:hypothetical protein [Verrucomicrobiae bacterium]